MPSLRSSEVLNSIPPATFAIIALCCAVYAYQIVLDLDIHHFTMNPRSIIYLKEYYRLITSTLFHGSLMHIAMNMMSTFAICSLLESRLGTIRLTLTILWAMLLTSATYTLAAFLLHILFKYDHLMFQHALGFSGVIFHLSVLECNLTQGSRSLFGVVSVPSYLYPWILLLALQFIMPNLSFMGHLAGILTGTLHSYGTLEGIFIGELYTKEMEGWMLLRTITSVPNFIPTPADTTTTTVLRDGASSSLGQAIWRAAQLILQFIKNVGETLHFIVLGRGQDANSNTQLGWGTTTSRTVVESRSDDFDDEDWVGLPEMQALSDPEQSRLL